MDFRVLGPMEVLHRGRLLPLGGRRLRALLAILLVHSGEVVTADRLIEELWGADAPPSAAKLLHVYVSRLRKSLDGGPSDPISTTAGGYVLHVEPGALDSERFLTLAADGRRALAEGEPERAAAILDDALALWRGPAFVDVAYASFAQNEIARLEEARLAALEDRIDAELAQGLHGGIVGDVQALLAEHPLRERLAAQLMLSLYRSGRQADALEVFQRTRRLLVDELGLEPGGALRGLQEAILRQDPELQAPPAAVPAPAAPAARRRLPVAGATLLGIAAIAAVAVLLAHGGAAGPPVEPNSVAGIDPRTGRVVASVPVGVRPDVLSVGDGALWVANLDDDSVSRIDLPARQVVRTIPTMEAPAGLAAGAGGCGWQAPTDRCG